MSIAEQRRRKVLKRYNGRIPDSQPKNKSPLEELDGMLSEYSGKDFDSVEYLRMIRDKEI